MGEWREYKFSDFVDISPPVSLRGKLEYSFIEMKDLHDGNKYSFPNTKRILSGGARFIEGDTLFARITPCLENGKICKVKGLEGGVGFGSTEFLVFRGRENISDNDFVFYLSRWDEVRGFAESNFEGTSGRQRVPKSCFDNLLLDLPLLSEQRAIASILSSLDDKIDLLHRQNRTFEQLAETLFRQWFVEEADESWEEEDLEETADYLNGLALQKFPSKGFDDLPVIKIREMKQGISENTDRCSREIPQQYVIQDGDILFSWSGSLEVVIWSGGEGALNQHLFKVSSDKYPKWFYYLATKSHLPTFRSIAESKTTTMGHIQREHLKQATILIPPKELFDSYDKAIAPVIEKVIKNNFQILILTQLHNTLLPKLMSGEVRVKWEDQIIIAEEIDTKPIYTIGHSNHSIEKFIRLLNQNKINIVVDIRSTPYSRYNPQYNREQLQQSLKLANIKYMYMGKELGGRPKDLDDYNKGVADYDRILIQKDFKDGIDRLLKGRKDFNIVIMCSEKDPLNCHRMLLVGRDLKKFNVPIKHILADGKVEDNSFAEKRLLDITGLKPTLFELDLDEKQQLEEAYKKRSLEVAFKLPNVEEE